MIVTIIIIITTARARITKRETQGIYPIKGT